MNTRMGKKALTQVLQQANIGTNDNLHYYSLPDALEGDGIMYIIQDNPPAHAFKYFSSKVEEHVKELRRREWEMAVIRKGAELLGKMKKEL